MSELRKIQITVGHCLKAGRDVYPDSDPLEIPKDLDLAHAQHLIAKGWARPVVEAEPEPSKPALSPKSGTVTHGDPSPETRDPKTDSPPAGGRGRRKSGGR